MMRAQSKGLSQRFPCQQLATRERRLMTKVT